MNQRDNQYFFTYPGSTDLQQQQLSLAPTSLNESSSLSHNNRRKIFALQIKYLLKVLKDAGEDELRDQARTVISYCTRQNRNGDQQFTPLETVIESYLLTLVGQGYWDIAKKYQRQYLHQRLYQRKCGAAAALVSPSSRAVQARQGGSPINPVAI